ncbi:prepilin-type N-terminal cleavage/methylation domain-containing protein [Gorillibacterium sp. sgz5001074]|uniref:prepilin-type N-terminal cleavage/methylation domain-containing protein n=1 Tax=Gorillibacterium sp. sgz5001074 TaxID=3446695 RepID=UPI003F681342
MELVTTQFRHFTQKGFKKLHKDEKGMTLIELLAVIVILAIIAAIAIPSISAIIRNSERSSQRANAHTVVDAARLAIASRGVSGIGADETATHANITSPGTGGQTRKITLQELIDSGYLSEIKDPYRKGTTYNPASSYVIVTRTSTTSGSITSDVYKYWVYIMPGGTGAPTTPYFNDTEESLIDEPNQTTAHTNL